MSAYLLAFPSGAELGLWVGLVLIFATGGALLQKMSRRISIVSIVLIMGIGAVLVENALLIQHTKSMFDEAITAAGSMTLPYTSTWTLGSLGVAACLAVIGACFALSDGNRTLAFMYATLAFVVGAVLAQGGFLRFYADGWVLAHGICWLAAGVCFGAFAIGLVLDFMRAYQGIRELQHISREAMKA